MPLNSLYRSPPHKLKKGGTRFYPGGGTASGHKYR